MTHTGERIQSPEQMTIGAMYLINSRSEQFIGRFLNARLSDGGEYYALFDRVTRLPCHLVFGTLGVKWRNVEIRTIGEVS